MKVHASAGRDYRRNVFDHCERLDLRTRDAQQARWLAELLRVFMDGGRLAIEAKGRERMEVEIPHRADMDDAPPQPSPDA